VEALILELHHHHLLAGRRAQADGEEGSLDCARDDSEGRRTRRNAKSRQDALRSSGYEKQQQLRKPHLFRAFVRDANGAKEVSYI
jgi:hypothetical protein